MNKYIEGEPEIGEAQRKFDPGYPLIKRGLYYCIR